MRSWIISCCIGISVVTLFPKLPELGWPLVLILLPLTFCVVVSLKYKPLKLFGALSFGLIWGVIYGCLGLHQIIPHQYENIDLIVEGEVVGLPDVSVITNNRARQRFLMNVRSLRDSDGAVIDQQIKKIRLNWYQTDQPVKPGEYWRLTIRLKRPHGLANPGSFDYETYLFRQGIGATGYVRADSQNRLLSEPGWNSLADRSRYVLAQRLAQSGAQTSYPEVLRALLIGDRSEMDGDLWRTVTRTGTNHLFVISGLHVGFISLCFYSIIIFTSRFILLGAPRVAAQQIASVAALLGSTGYCALAGFSLPTQRALIMLAIMLMGRVFKRHTDIYDSFLAALLFVMLWDPLAVRSVGFWLSFGAVAALILGFKGYTGTPGFWWRWGRPQWLVFLVFIPGLLFFFGQFSLISPLANSFAIPLVGMTVVPLCLSGGLLLLLSEDLSAKLLFLADQIVALVFKGLAILEQWPFALLEFNPEPLSLAIALVGMILLALPKGLPGRGLAILMLLPLVTKQDDLNENGTYELTVFDVGQGLSVLVETARHRLIYDVGPRYSESFNAADAVLLPYFQRTDIRYLDRIVLSHSDNDHAGALADLAAQVEFGDIVAGSEPPALFYEQVTGCSSGRRWDWDGIEFMLMQATPDVWNNENNRSCVLRVDNGTFATLLAGDIEQQAENSLINQFSEQLKANLLIAPHHGSRTSSSDPFIHKVRPDQVVFAAGYRNRFGHPKPDIVERYRSLGAITLSTVDTGAISLTAQQQGVVTYRLYRNERWGYWY